VHRAFRGYAMVGSAYKNGIISLRQVSDRLGRQPCARDNYLPPRSGYPLRRSAVAHPYRPPQRSRCSTERCYPCFYKWTAAGTDADIGVCSKERVPLFDHSCV